MVTIRIHAKAVNCVAFSPDVVPRGQAEEAIPLLLAAASSDETASVVRVEEAVAHALHDNGTEGWPVQFVVSSHSKEVYTV